MISRHIYRQRSRFPRKGSLLIIGQFKERNAELEWAAVSGEEHCVTTLITAAKETKSWLESWFGIQTSSVPIPRQQQTKHCVQECPNCNIWGCGLRNKRFEGSRLCSKRVLGLETTKWWGSGVHGKNLGLPGSGPTYGTLKENAAESLPYVACRSLSIVIN